MSTASRTAFDVEAYLAWDASHEGRHELVNGEILAMTGAGEAHGIVVGNAFLALASRLRGSPCRAFVADLRVRIAETDLYAYPDLVAVYGERLFEPTTPETLVNPGLLIEVLSPSTASYDRGAKVAHYRRGPSVTDIVLLDPEERTVEHYARVGPDEWRLTLRRDGVVALVGLGVELPLAELFEGLDAR